MCWTGAMSGAGTASVSPLSKRQRARLEDVVRAMTHDLLRVVDNDELKRIESAYSLRSPEPEDIEWPPFDNPFGEGGMFGPDAEGSDEEGNGHLDGPDAPMGRKQTARQQAREDAEAQRDTDAQHAVRDVYRSLASALHPDRELDSAERARKTALMQRVNVACGAKNLLALLELQLEIEQIDQTAIGNISAARLAHFNRVLAEQFNELKYEVFLEKHFLRLDYGVPDEVTRLPSMALRALDREAQAMRQELGHVERDLELLQDIKGIKAWLNGAHVEYSMDDGFPDIDELMAIAAMFAKR